MKFKFLSILFLYTFSLSIHNTCAQVNNKTIIHNGIERSYLIHLPKEYNSKKKTPLVFAFHGAGDSAYMFMYHSGFNNLADRDNVIVVYPQGLKRFGRTGWNNNYGDKKEHVDDVAFVERLLDVLTKNYNIDEDNIFTVGMSNGGFMAFLLACEMSDFISGVASITGSMTKKMKDKCKVEKSMPVLQMHGTHDKAVPYLGHKKWSIPIDSVINHWVGVNEIKDKPKKRVMSNIDKTDGSYVERYTYKNRLTKAKVIHYKVINGGHDWFGKRGNKDVDATNIVWNFFFR